MRDVYVEITAEKNGVVVTADVELKAKDCFEAINILMQKMEVAPGQIRTVQARPPYQGIP